MRIISRHALPLSRGKSPSSIGVSADLFAESENDNDKRRKSEIIIKDFQLVVEGASAVNSGSEDMDVKMRSRVS